MIEHTKLQALITRIIHYHDTQSWKSDIMHPRREWAVGLGASLILLAGVTGLSFYLYTVSSTTPELTDEQVDTVVPYRASVVEAALIEYRVRAEQYQGMIQSRAATDMTVPIATSTVPDSGTTATTSPRTPTSTDSALIPNSTTSPMTSETASTATEPTNPASDSASNSEATPPQLAN